MMDIDNADLGMVCIVAIILCCLGMVLAGQSAQEIMTVSSVGIAAVAGIARGKSNGS